MEPRTISVRANGLRFECLTEGEGPLVLMLHGFPDTPHTWDAVRPAVAAAGYRVVCPFTRGYAPTEIPADGRYDATTLASDVVELLRALGESPAIVVAHDFGAAAAYGAAAMAPERMRLLVTLAIPHPGAMKPSLRVLWGARHFFTLRIPGAARRIRARDLAHLDELVARWSPGWNVPAGETDAVKRSLREPGSLEAALGYYRAMTPSPPAMYRRRITVPTVVFAAEDDGILVLADYEGARRRFEGPYEVIPMRGGHFLHREDPASFTAKLLEVLAARAPADARR
jgi:pimeloyl-ACP methyl ester carboxylesterase